MRALNRLAVRQSTAVPDGHSTHYAAGDITVVPDCSYRGARVDMAVTPLTTLCGVLLRGPVLVIHPTLATCRACRKAVTT